MDYKNDCLYYYVCIDKGCPCKLVHDTVRNEKAYKALLEEQEQEHGQQTFTAAKMIQVGPMHIPENQLETLALVLGATITEIPEFRCCTQDEGCGAICDCPYDFKELFSHLTPGESQTVVCEKTNDLVCIHRLLSAGAKIV